MQPYFQQVFPFIIQKRSWKLPHKGHYNVNYHLKLSLFFSEFHVTFYFSNSCSCGKQKYCWLLHYFVWCHYRWYVVPLIWLLVLFLIDPNMSFKIGDMNFASYFNHRSSWPRKDKFLVVSKTKILFYRDISLSVCDNILYTFCKENFYASFKTWFRNLLCTFFLISNLYPP